MLLYHQGKIRLLKYYLIDFVQDKYKYIKGVNKNIKYIIKEYKLFIKICFIIFEFIS